MERIKRFIKTAVTYLAGNIFSKLVTFFLIPLYTNKLTTESYGDYDVVLTIVTLLVSVAFFQIWDGMFRMSFDYDDLADKYKIISICFKGYLIGIIVFSLAYYGVLKVMSLEMSIWSLLFGVSFGLQYMYSFSTRIFLRNKLFALSGAANTLALAVSNIVLIVGFNRGVESLFISQVIGAIVQILIIEARLHILRNIKGMGFDYSTFNRVLRFSVPLCIATVSYWLLSGYTKIIIKKVCGSSDNGLFAIASSLSNMAVLAVNVFQFAWNETAYLMSGEQDRNKTYKKCLDLLFCTVWICCAAFCIMIRIIYPYYIGQDFQASSIVIPYLMLGVSANAIAGFLGTLFMTEQKTSHIMTSTFVAAAFNIGLSELMTKRFGLVGAVLVLSGSFMLLMILRLFQVRANLKISISFVSIISFLPVIISVIMYKNNTLFILDVLFLVAIAIIYIILFEIITNVRVLKLLQSIIRRNK